MGKKRYSSTLGVVEPEEEVVSMKRNSPTLGVYGDVKKKVEPLEFPLPSAPESQEELGVSSQEEPLKSQSSGFRKAETNFEYEKPTYIKPESFLSSSLTEEDKNKIEFRNQVENDPVTQEIISNSLSDKDEGSVRNAIINSIVDQEERFFKAGGYDNPSMASVPRKIYMLGKELSSIPSNEMSDEKRKALIDKYKVFDITTEGLVKPYPEDIKKYADDFGFAYRGNIDELLKSDKLLNDASDNFKAGVNDLYAGTRDIVGLAGLNALPSWVDGTQYWREVADDWRNKISREDLNIVQNIQQGNTKEGIENAIIQFSGSAPMLAALATGNAAGYENAMLALLGGTSAANRYSETEGKINNDWARGLDALLYGGFEAIPEKFGTSNTLKLTQQALKKGYTNEQAKKMLTDVYKTSFDRFMYNTSGAINNSIRGGIDEASTQIAQNVLDGKGLEGVGDAFVLGWGTDFLLSLPQYKQLSKEDSKKIASDIISKMPKEMNVQSKTDAFISMANKNGLEKKSENLDPAFKDVVNSDIKDVNNEIKITTLSDADKIKESALNEELNNELNKNNPSKEKVDFLDNNLTSIESKVGVKIDGGKDINEKQSKRNNIVKNKVSGKESIPITKTKEVELNTAKEETKNVISESNKIANLEPSKGKVTEQPTREKKVSVEAPEQEISTSPEGKTTIGNYELNDLEQKQYNEMVQEKGKAYTDRFFITALELHPPEIYNIQPGERVKAEMESKAVSPQELSDLYIKDVDFRQKVNQRAKEQGRDYSTIDDKQYVYNQLPIEETKAQGKGVDVTPKGNLETQISNAVSEAELNNIQDNIDVRNESTPELTDIIAKKRIELQNVEPNIHTNEKEMQRKGETPEEVANVQQMETSAELQQTNVEPLITEENAKGNGMQIENGGQQTQGLVEGEEGRLRLRDDVESGLPTQEQKEDDVEENFHSAVTKGLDRGIEWLDNLDKELSKFSKETLGVNLPVVVAKAALNTAKLTLQAGKTVSEAVDSAINYVKSSDWYKSLGNDDKVKAENNIRDIFNKKPSEVVNLTEGKFTAIPSGTKERVTAKKALASKELSDEVKKAVEGNKTYTVSNHKAMKERFSKIVNRHVESGNIDELKSIILNENSNLQPESRIILASAFVEEIETLASTSENKIEADYYKEQSKEVFSNYLLPLSTQIAKGLKAFDVLTDVIGRNPDLYVESLRDKINSKNEDTLKAYENDVLNSKRIIDEYIQSDEFKRLLDKKVKEAMVDKTLSADRIERGRAKMASGSSKILKALGTLKNAVNEGEKSGDTLKQIGEGLVEFADGLLDVGVVSVESLFREIKVKFREYLTPSEIDNFREEILKKTDAKNRVRPTKKYSSRDVLSEAELNKLVNSVYGKMVSADKKQLKRLAIDYLDRVIESNIGGKGEINDASFKELFASAIGLDTLTPKHEAILRDVAGRLNDARNITNNLDWLYGEAEKVSNNTDKASKLLFDKLNKIIDVQFSEYKKAIKEANDANKKASKIFTEELSYGDLGATFLQGNLITPASQITNVVGNTFVLIPRTAAYFVGNVTDMIWYGVDKALFAIKNKYNDVDFIRRKLANVEPERHFSLMAAGKGYSVGFAQGLIEGTQQLVNGQLPDDVFTRELKRGLEPIRKGIENFRMLSGKEQLRISSFIKNTFEATIGLSPEITFRLLNLGDKPFRRAAEQSRLYELADLNGLKGIAKERFINLPPEWALEEARNAGLKATYQNDNLISGFLLKAKNTSSQKYQHAVEGLNKVDKAMWGIGRFFLKSQIPFVKTPTNVMIETFEFGIPVFSLAKALYYSKAGDSRNASIYFGKFVVGSLMDAAITSIIYSGVLTLGQAQGEEDEEAKKRVRESEYRNVPAYSINSAAFYRWMRTGDPSFRAGDNIKSYKRFGLFSSLMMGRAEALKGQDLGSKDDIFSVTSTLERQVTSVFPMVRASLQQSYLSGVNTLLSSVFGGDEDIDKWIVNTSRAFSAAIIPQTYVKINDERQKYMKERRDEAVSFMNKKDKTRDWEGIKKQWEDLYGSGDNLTNKLTVWGEDIRYIPDGKSLAWYLFNITQSKVYNGDFGVKLHELYVRTGDEKVLPSPEPIQVKFEGIPIKLTADLRYELEKEFRSYRRNEIELFVNSNDYDLMNDEDRLFYLQAEYNRVNAYKGEFVNEFIERNYPQIEKLWETQKK